MARNSTKFRKLVSIIKSRSAKQRIDIQEALVECAMFAFEDRNVDPAIRLFEAVGGETHRAGMSKWLSLNAAVHFKDGRPMLSDAKQKELAGSMTASEYEQSIREMPAWYVMDEANNNATNVWDTSEFLKKVDEYLLGAIKKAKKHDAAVGEMLDTAHNLFRAEMAKVAEVVEQ